MGVNNLKKPEETTCTSGMDPTTPAESRLCGIYLRDILTLLPRKNINTEFRAVSRYLDATVRNFPEPKLPRHRFTTLYFYTVSYYELDVNIRGIPLRSDCCHELKVIEHWGN